MVLSQTCCGNIATLKSTSNSKILGNKISAKYSIITLVFPLNFGVNLLRFEGDNDDDGDCGNGRCTPF